MKKTSIAAFVLALCAGASFAMDTATVPAGVIAKPGAAASTAVGSKAATPAAPGGASTSITAYCEAKAVDKNGKSLSGAAKVASIKKCGDDASVIASKPAMQAEVKVGAKTDANTSAAASTEAQCEAKALSKEGKALFGAAKASSVKKCVAAASVAVKK